MSAESRVPAGVPTGGQFSTQTRTEADASLPADQVEPGARTRSLQNAENDVRQQIFDTAVDEISKAIRHRFPDAAYLILSDEGDGGSPYFAPAGILDADGSPLFGLDRIREEQQWRGAALDVTFEDPEFDDDDEDFTDELAELTPSLDRLGMDAVTLRSDHWFNGWQGIALTR